MMNQELYVLAEFKRWLADEIGKRRNEIGRADYVLIDAAEALLRIEANAVIGEEEEAK